MNAQQAKLGSWHEFLSVIKTQRLNDITHTYNEQISIGYRVPTLSYDVIYVCDIFINTLSNNNKLTKTKFTKIIMLKAKQNHHV